MLAGKHIVLGITGSIAAYKAAALTRLFVKSGAEVQVIMTPAAREFITPLTLSTLSGKAVITEFFSANDGRWNSHVDLGLWADAFVVAPATASTIAKMANGVADNMLITSYLSTRGKVFIAPAMDLDMMAHPSTQANLRKLEQWGATVIEPATGELASHLIGKGRMEEPENIVTAISQWFAVPESPLQGKHLLVTAGPTYEKIDPVRFIGNYSSGKMGYAIAREAARRGATVTLVSGPVSLPAPSEQGVTTVRVESAREMLQACQEAWPTADMAIMAAAVADYRPAESSNHKIKRESARLDNIPVVENPDIAATLGASKRAGQTLVGFALETDSPLANARAKMARKGLDFIVVNSLAEKGAGFNTDTNRVDIIRADGSEAHFPLKSKEMVAADILDFVANPQQAE